LQHGHDKEMHLIVDSDVYAATDSEAGQVRQGKCFGDNTLATEGGIAVNHYGQSVSGACQQCA
jgi:hypothetical protein